MANLLEGKKISERIKEDLKREISDLKLRFKSQKNNAESLGI